MIIAIAILLAAGALLRRSLGTLVALALPLWISVAAGRWASAAGCGLPAIAGAALAAFIAIPLLAGLAFGQRRSGLVGACLVLAFTLPAVAIGIGMAKALASAFALDILTTIALVLAGGAWGLRTALRRSPGDIPPAV